jgi:outer membrane protein
LKKLSLAASLIAVLTTSLVSVSAHAEQKIGVVSGQMVLQSLPQTAVILQQIQAEFKDRAAEVDALKKEFEYLGAKLQREAATMSEAEKKEVADKAVATRQAFMQKAKQLEDDSRNRQNQERNKLSALIKQHIDIVAKEGKFDMVLNAEAVSYLGSEQLDLSQSVIDSISKAK